MKRIYIVLFVLFVTLITSCNNWLDVKPTDIVDQNELFKVGSGYRIALNGVYKDMSKEELYGREMSWGMVDVIGRMYDPSGFSVEIPFTNFYTYDYAFEDTKSVIQSIWSKAYNVVANCNNIIGRIEKEDVSKFEGGEMEKSLIIGEAYAARSLMHFDMLRLFAAAPMLKTDKQFIPYFNTFPSVVEPYRTVDEMINFIISDLKKAKSLVAEFDLYYNESMNNRRWLESDMRFKSTTGTTESAQSDIFFACRGFRLNYLAISAILARVYNYAQQHELAKNEALEVIEFQSYQGTYALGFTLSGEVQYDRKMTRDLIFALSDFKLVTKYLQYTDEELLARLLTKDDYSEYESEGGDMKDYRVSTLLATDNDFDFYPVRNYELDLNNVLTKNGADMLPVIRLSEMHYIVAEAYAANSDFTNAELYINNVRAGRGCTITALYIEDQESFFDVLITDVRKEFMGEGQSYYYYKKYNIKPHKSMPDGAFIFPLPQNETVN